MKRFAMSFLSTVLCIICFRIILLINWREFLSIFNNNIGFFKLLQIGFYAFLCVLSIIGCIISLIGSIYNMICVFSVLFFSKKEIHVSVDENYVIRDSFIELSNGKIIPIRIKKIVMNKPENEESNGEAIEENNQQ